VWYILSVPSKYANIARGILLQKELKRLDWRERAEQKNMSGKQSIASMQVELERLQTALLEKKRRRAEEATLANKIKRTKRLLAEEGSSDADSDCEEDVQVVDEADDNMLSALATVSAMVQGVQRPICDYKGCADEDAARAEFKMGWYGLAQHQQGN
jgi:hypothetical protein